MNEEDPLRELVVDAVELDRQRIANALKGVLVIHNGGQVVPRENFNQLDARQKVLAFLLGRKAAVLVEEADEEATTPTELAEESGMPEGTVKPKLRELHSDRLVSQDVDGRYYLSPVQVGTAISRLVPSDESGGLTPSVSESRLSADASPRSKPRKKAAVNATSEGTTKKSRGTQGSSFSPTQFVRDRIADGFFDSPKTLSDIQALLKDKQGREVPLTSLSPLFTRLLRAGELDRSKNDEGSYQYVKPSG